MSLRTRLFCFYRSLIRFNLVSVQSAVSDHLQYFFSNLWENRWTSTHHDRCWSSRPKKCGREWWRLVPDSSKPHFEFGRVWGKSVLRLHLIKSYIRNKLSDYGSVIALTTCHIEATSGWWHWTFCWQHDFCQQWPVATTVECCNAWAVWVVQIVAIDGVVLVVNKVRVVVGAQWNWLVGWNTLSGQGE